MVVHLYVDIRKKHTHDPFVYRIFMYRRSYSDQFLGMQTLSMILLIAYADIHGMSPILVCWRDTKNKCLRTLFVHVDVRGFRAR